MCSLNIEIIIQIYFLINCMCATLTCIYFVLDHILSVAVHNDALNKALLIN